MKGLAEITKALSVKQPLAWLIVHGYKDFENRDWPYEPSFRGRFAVHAGRSFNEGAYDWVLQRFPRIRMPRPEEFERSGIVGTVEMVDVVRRSRSRWFCGPLGFELARPQVVPFIPLKGLLGFFNLPPHVVALLAKPLETDSRR